MQFVRLLMYVATAFAYSPPKHEPFRVDMWHKQEAVSPLGAKFKVASPQANPLGGTLRYVENSGVCETTAGVYQASGYADLDGSRSMWFWFFEARNSPETAPLAIWLNGGSLIMIGLFQENGPCRINNDSQTVSRNPYSWNEYANMLYIDQPVGVDILQQPELQQVPDKRICTLDGGHYGPAFSHYFEQQNAIIDAGQGNGLLKINLKTLGIGNGLTDPLSQYPEYINYALNNRYLQTESNDIIQSANSSLYTSGGCLEQIQNCYDTKVATTCSSAQDYCNSHVLFPSLGDRNIYDIRTTWLETDDYPPDFSKFLRNTTIMQLIGAEVNYMESNGQIVNQFHLTGDWMFNSALDLAPVVDSGVRTFVFAGDADFYCNVRSLAAIFLYITYEHHQIFGVEAMMKNLPTKFQTDYNSQSLANWTVDGVLSGWYINSGNLSYLRVKDAGHEVSAYGTAGLAIGQASLLFFKQVMQGLPISST
ncbi:alpha/beta-hydrolase [Auriculariales sp. MPI-PUGE-AT-0066]|nr:alpha/beta-hydrolase [Auriculariales sp. MPI-PUGE-AT-0066]